MTLAEFKQLAIRNAGGMLCMKDHDKKMMVFAWSNWIKRNDLDDLD